MEALRSVGREAREGAQRAFALRDGVIFWALGAAALFTMSFCVAPFALGSYVLGRAVQRANRAPHRRTNTTTLAGLAMVGVLAAPGLAVFVAMSLVPEGYALGPAGVAAVFFVVPLFGLLSGPFLTVSSHLMRRGLGLDDAFGRSLASATAVGATRMVLRGLAVGLVVSIPSAACITMLLLARAGFSGLLPLMAFLVLPPTSLAWFVGFASACAEEDDVSLAGRAPPVARVRLLLAPMIAIAFLFVATLLAASKPLAPWQGRPPTPLTCEPTLEDYGPHGLNVHPGPVHPGAGREALPDYRRPVSSFIVETADGGGAGEIMNGHWLQPTQVCVDREGVVWLVWGDLAEHGDSGDASVVPVDERGVRLDDGIGDRLAERSGVFLDVSFTLGLCLLLIGLAELARRTALLDVMGRSDDTLRTAAGRVEFSDAPSNASITAMGHVTGSARFSSDDGGYAFSLPSRVRLVGACGPLSKDTKVLLVATERLDSLSLRDGTARWPRSAILIVGRADDARRAVMAELSRVVGLWAAAATIGFTLAAVALLFAL